MGSRQFLNRGKWARILKMLKNSQFQVQFLTKINQTYRERRWLISLQMEMTTIKGLLLVK